MAMLPALLLSLALMALLVLLMRWIAGGEAPPAPTASRLELGWPRGVQEEEPVYYRTDLLVRHWARWGRRSTNPLPIAVSARPRDLRDVARVIGIQTPCPRRVHGVELSGDDGRDRREVLRQAARETDRPPGERQEVVTIRDDHRVGAEVVTEPPEQRLEIGGGTPGRRQREDREPGIDEGNRTVAEVRGGVRVGDDLCELLELERPLARGRVLVAAPHDHARVP